MDAFSLQNKVGLHDSPAEIISSFLRKTKEIEEGICTEEIHRCSSSTSFLFFFFVFKIVCGTYIYTYRLLSTLLEPRPFDGEETGEALSERRYLFSRLNREEGTVQKLPVLSCLVERSDRQKFYENSNARLPLPLLLLLSQEHLCIGLSVKEKETTLSVHLYIYIYM